MILRGAVLTENRFSLKQAVPEPRTPEPPMASPLTLPTRESAASPSSQVSPGSQVSQGPQVSLGPPMTPGSLGAPGLPGFGVAPERPPIEHIVPAPITFEAVVEWLNKDDERARLIELLADDLATVRSIARSEGKAEGHAEGHAEGRAEGRAEGKAEGLSRAKEQADQLVRTLESVVSRTEQALQAQIEELGGFCAEVVCVAFAKIAGPVLSMREAALGTVLEVLKRVKDDGEVVIRVSAQDLTAMQEYAADMERACVGRKFSLVADNRVEAGGCIVDTALGSLDGRFEVQLRALGESLRAAKASLSEAS